MYSCRPTHQSMTNHIHYRNVFRKMTHFVYWRSRAAQSLTTQCERLLTRCLRLVYLLCIYHKQEIRSVELGVCPMQLFHFWSRDVRPVQNAAVYKISSKSDDFSLRYGDISIFNTAAVRHLGIVLPPYETTHEVSVAGRSCLSNYMSIWYTDLNIYRYLNFSHIWFEMPIQAPKWGVWRTLNL